MGLVRLEGPGEAGFDDFLREHEPLSLRIRGALAEKGDEATIWVDDPDAPALVVHQTGDMLGPVGEPERMSRHLDDLEAIAREAKARGLIRRSRELPGEENILRLSALPAPARDAIAARRRLVRENPCGLYTLSKEDFSPCREGPRIENIREEEYELVAGLAQYGEGTSYLEERLAGAPHAAVRVGGELAAYMIVHANGSIGMLHTIEKFRGRGLGRRVASAMAEMQFERGRPVYCYIVGGNVASERVFNALGFRRAADVSWAAFEMAEE